MERDKIYYNYFKDVNPNYKEKNFIMKSRTDPDQCSAQLYDALYKLFFYDGEVLKSYKINCVQVVGQKFKDKPLFYSFVTRQDNNLESKVKFILSSDYIGPSIYQSSVIGQLKNSEIKEIVERGRTLGGHMIWPRGSKENTVNKVRGGEIYRGCGYGFYDRIDLPLQLLKIYYKVINENNNYRKQKFEEIIRTLFTDKIWNENHLCFEAMFQAFDDVSQTNAREWFKIFKTFEQFSIFFKLVGSFVDEGYEVVQLTDFFPIKPAKESYKKYIQNNLNAIEMRNKILESC